MKSKSPMATTVKVGAGFFSCSRASTKINHLNNVEICRNNATVASSLAATVNGKSISTVHQIFREWDKPDPILFRLMCLELIFPHYGWSTRHGTLLLNSSGIGVIGKQRVHDSLKF